MSKNPPIAVQGAHPERPPARGKRAARRSPGYHWSVEPDLANCAVLHPMVSGLFGFVVSSTAEPDLSRRKT